MPAVTQTAGLSAASTANNNNNNVSKDTRNPNRYCNNPFRIPNHKNTVTDLRNVSRIVREQLSHVHFGVKICGTCRSRVYKMLKERNQLKPSERLKNNNNGILGRGRSELPRSTQPRLQQQPQQRRSDPLPSTAAIATADAPVKCDSPPAPDNKSAVTVLAPVKQVTMTVTASSEAEQRAIESLFTEDYHQDMAGSSSQVSCEVSNLEVESSELLIEAMSRRSRPQVQQQQSNLAHSEVQRMVGPVMQICCFCGLTEDNELEFGKFYHQDGVVTHYYCLLLSSNMEQRGNDDEGILGFLVEDILKEIKRGRRLVCSHCKKNGATLGCCNAKCKRIFHFPCGLKAGSLHQFFGEFRSYCINHRPKQKIDERLIKEIESMKNILCYICYEDVVPLDTTGTLWAPCCKKNAWFHRKCVQQLAMSAGYFFKCPLCNNKREFQTAMLEYGIYIPRQDASWELVPNAFEELLYRHDRCDAAACLCPKGRTYTSSNAKWELILCRMCGSQGTHIACGGLKWVNPVWECQECITILTKSTENTMTDDSTTNSNEIPTRRRESTFNVTIRECDEDSDSDISVGNESIPLETNLTNIPTIIPQIKLRPGPKSFKLQQIQKLQNSDAYKEIMKKANDSEGFFSVNDSNTNANNRSNSLGVTMLSAIPAKVTNNDIICIDSDEEAVEIVCENVMRRTNKNRRHFFRSNFVGTSSSNSSSLSNQMNYASPIVTGVLPAETHDSSFNIIISNVTSVPAEFFASVPEAMEEGTAQQVTPPVKVPVTPSMNGLKRIHPSDDEEVDVLIVEEAQKRPRLESNITTNHNIVSEVACKQATTEAQTDSDSKIGGQNSIESVLSNIKLSPSKINTEDAASAGSSISSSSHISCDGDAGTGPAILTTGDEQHAGEMEINVDVYDEPNSQSANAESAVSRPELAIRTILENGSSSHCSSSGGSGGSTKSRYSSGDRSGLIPDYVRLRDLKFKIRGSDIELSYRACRIQVKMNGVQSSNSTTLNDTSSAETALVSPFAGSSQHLLSEKSSKSFHIRSEESTDESDRIFKSLRTRSFRSFVYEDDNTLLEYPTSANDTLNNTKKSSPIITDKKLTRSDLKENWDPEVSNSSNNDLDSSVISNNKQTGTMDLKEDDINCDKSSKIEEHSFLQSPKEDISSVQRLLRRSNRIVRHFRSVQQSKLNGQINGEFIDSKMTSFSSSFDKSNLLAADEQSIKSPRSLKVLNSSVDVVEQQDSKKHLRNVEIDELRLTLTSQINGLHNNNDLNVDADLKVSIDLQKISNLINAKPDLFFRTKNSGVRGLRVYSMNEKLKVEFKPGETKFLTKSQSFDCLLDNVNDGFSYFAGRSKSFESLSSIDKHDLMPLIDIKDCIEMKTRKSQRRKTRQFEKHECVR